MTAVVDSGAHGEWPEALDAALATLDKRRARRRLPTRESTHATRRDEVSAVVDELSHFLVGDELA